MAAAVETTAAVVLLMLVLVVGRGAGLFCLVRSRQRL